MLLSTAIPIVIAAIVIVIRSRGIDNSPIVPKTTKHAIKFGIIVRLAILNDLKRINSIMKMPNSTIDKDLICESKRLSSILL